MLVGEIHHASYQTFITSIRNLMVTFLIDEVVTLDCYQCTSEDEWKCMDGELVENSLMPTNCSHIYGARYCIKSVGRYGGSYVQFHCCIVVDGCAWMLFSFHPLVVCFIFNRVGNV